MRSSNRSWFTLGATWGLARPAAQLRPWPLLAILGLVAIALTAVGVTAYRSGSVTLKRDELNQMRTVASLKATTIARWLDERRANARALSRDPAVVSAIATWLISDAQPDRVAVLGAFSSMRITYGFSSVQLIDVNGRALLSDGQPTLDGARLQKAIGQALADQSVAMVDLYRPDSANGVRMGLVAPVQLPRGAPEIARMLIVLEIRPDDYLYSILESWPTPAATGEAALVRQEWGNIVYLNNLRYQHDSALRVRVPISAATLPAAKLLLGEASEVEGTDYRGTKVLAAGVPVPSTPWFVLTKIDEEEAFQSIRRLAVITVVLTGAALVLAAGVAGFVWQRQHLRAALFEVEQRKETAAAELRFQATFDQAETGVAHLDLEGRWLRVNQRICELMGYSREALLATDIQSVTAPQYRAEDHAYIQKFMRGEIQSRRGERLTHRPDGSAVWVDFTVSLVRAEDGTPQFVLLVLLDITARKDAELALRERAESLRQAAAVFSNTQEGVVVTDPGGTLVAVNPAVCAITGYSEDELIGDNMRKLQSGRHDAAFYQRLWTAVRTAGFWQGEIWNRRKSGEVYPELLTISTVRDDQGDIANYVGTFTDITHIKKSQEQLEQLAHHDPLTGLPNRLLLHSRLEHALERAARHKSNGAVLFLDLDRFKNVNDSLGHPAGDELLTEVARRLRARLRDSDTLARLGGDEFVVVLEDLGSPEQAAGVAQSLIERLSESFALQGGHEVYIGASIGISLFPADSETASILIQQADTALYEAKENGKGIYRFYRSALTDAANARLALEARLRRGLEREEMLLHFQPLIRMSDRRMVGVEALLRWQDPAEGLVPPDRFIPLAEETGLIVPLGDWALRAACRRVQAWRQAGLMIDNLAVNLSPRQFQLPDIGERVRDILVETGLPPACLELEITESALMQQGEETLHKLAVLKQLGIRLAIDDFGTGYSSLAYLKRFPIDKLKIDKSFVVDIPGDPANMEITAAIIGLAKNLKLEVLAEGVETETQLAFLKRHGCDTAQGFLFARPLAPENLARFAAENAAPPDPSADHRRAGK